MKYLFGIFLVLFFGGVAIYYLAWDKPILGAEQYSRKVNEFRPD